MFLLTLLVIFDCLCSNIEAALRI